MDSLTLEDEGTGFFQNVGNHWPSNIVSHSRRPESLSFSFILKVFVYYVVTMLVIRMWLVPFAVAALFEVEIVHSDATWLFKFLYNFQYS